MRSANLQINDPAPNPTTRAVYEGEFETHDSTRLFYRHWAALSTGSRKAIVLLHRGHEHSARLGHLVEELSLPDCAFFAWDARGHGRSPGERGDGPSVAASVRDLDCFIRHIRDAHGIPTSEICVVAQSVGAVIAAAWVHDYAPPIRGLVLAAPAFKVKLYVPFARTALKVMQQVRGNFFVNSYVKARFLTHDPERIASYNADPLIARAISVRMLLGLYETAHRVVEDAQAIHVPTQVLVSGADYVVHRAPQARFFKRLGSKDKEYHSFKGFYHDTLGERDRHRPIARVREFVLRQFAATASTPELQTADRCGYTADEVQALKAPLPAHSFKRLRFAMTRLSMNTLGRLSDGVRVGLRTGFDSGRMLDYVYQNKAQGFTPVGRWIDRSFLDAVGWKGIRVRKVHLTQAIEQATRLVREHRLPVSILDIAAGHGRYVVDAVQRLPLSTWSVRLRDYSPQNVVAGQTLIRNRGLEHVISFEKADAFNAESIAAADPRPTLGIVSGLYELFPDNAPVQRSLAGLARAIPPGGYLIYTGQPWHPQLELIARTLTSHRNGEPWIMRRRSQAELDQLVVEAGFQKVEQWIDEWGIFTVSLAVRTS